MTTTSTNPWVHQPEVETAELALEAPPTAPVTGPLNPSIAPLTAPDHGLPFRRCGWVQPGTVWWLGVHGGAGESTLARLAPGTLVADHAWPVSDAPPDTVVLVARSSVPGLLAAQRAAQQWGAGLVPAVRLLGLAVLADHPKRPPRAIRDLHKHVAGGVPRIWSLPWFEPWRLGEEPTLEVTPRRFRTFLADVARLAAAPDA